MTGLVVDLFAGGGGASTGLEAALGRPVDIGINHDRIALAVHKANHPRTRHLEADIWEVQPTEATEGRPVEILWASPDCTHFSVAKGDVPKSKKIRSLAWAVAKWARAVRPSLIFVENVMEFRGWGPLGQDGKPNKGRMGETFRRWKGQLERLGYEVDYRIIDASLYGAPTRRRRLFLIARCDGQPIAWPETTHGPGKLPLHTAAECIDWALRRPSIFERKRPLAPKTQWRIAQGLRKYVFESLKPYIVRMAHGEVAPDGVTRRRGPGAADVDQPLPTVTGGGGGGGFALAVPSLVGVGGRAGQSHPTPADEPVGTVTAKNDRALVVPSLVKMRGEAHSSDVEGPVPTITAGGEKAGHTLGLAVASLMKFRHESIGASVDEPLPTITAGGKERPERQSTGNPLGLAAASLLKVNHGKHEARGESIEAPLSTVTAERRGHAVAAAALVKLRGDCHSADVEAPAPTITSNGLHIGEVRAFLTAYYGDDGDKGKGQSVLEPLRTLTAKHRLGLVTVEGVDYQIVDIGMRMLEPYELLRAQFGRFAAAYDMTAAVGKKGKPSKTAQVRLIGNSVCPEAVEALVLANAPAVRERVA